MWNRSMLLAAAEMFFLLPFSLTAQTVACGGREEREYHCAADTRHGVTLLQETGSARCIRGYSWDYEGGEIWVDNRCAAVFALTSHPPIAWQEERVPAGTYLISCAAGAETAYCVQAPQVSAELVRRTSDARCVEEKSWGVDERGLWLANGCAADFLMRQRTVTGQDALATRQLIECSSPAGQRNFCTADACGGAELRAVLGHAPCKPSESWGSNEGGVWVDHGCHGLFEVTGLTESGRSGVFPRCYLSVGEPLAAEWESECYALHLGKFASCNARASCAELTANIRRGCQAKGDAAPAYCEKYLAEEGGMKTAGSAEQSTK